MNFAINLQQLFMEVRPMFKLRYYLRYIVLAGLVFSFTAAGLWAQTPGYDVLRMMRQRDGNFDKPAYENRLAKPQVEELFVLMPEETLPAPAQILPTPQPVLPTPEKATQPPVKTVTTTSKPEAAPNVDKLLKMLPSESFFAIRVNNFEYTLGQLDQFLAGASPVPMGISMLARTQLAGVLGSPQLNSINMGGSFAMFGLAPNSTSNEPAAFPNIVIAALIPVTDYQQFISDNPNVSTPDENGISKIAAQGMPPMLAAPAGNFALVTSEGNYSNLLATAKSISDPTVAGLSATLDADLTKQDATEPIWAHGNVQLAAKIFGPVVFAKIDEIKKQLQSMPPQMTGQDPKTLSTIMDIYARIFEKLFKETKSLSIAINPKPDVLYISEAVSAVPGTDIADFLSPSVAPNKQNKLLGYLENNAMINYADRDLPSLMKLSSAGFDMFAAFDTDGTNSAKIEKLKKLMADMFNSFGSSVAFSMSIDPQTKPPFVAKYVIEVKDEKTLNQITDEYFTLSSEIVNSLYKNMGMQLNFKVKRAAETYKDVSIDSAKLVIKVTDTNSPQAQMINAMYGDGFDYRWAMVDGLLFCTVGGGADTRIRNLIDLAKAGGPKQLAPEIQDALTLLPNAEKADSVGTFNYLRLFKMVFAMMPVPMPQVDLPTKSNINFTGSAANGTLTVNVALPKEHLMEIVSVFQMMQQQKMQMMQQQMQQQPATPPNP